MKKCLIMFLVFVCALLLATVIQKADNSVHISGITQAQN